ncbi:MAG: Mpo1-like protein, partial [Methyloceanibacter sp.]
TALGYLCAWTAHVLVEKNRPAMVSHPAWAFQCDIRMFRLWITGQLKPELKKAGIS